MLCKYVHTNTPTEWRGVIIVEPPHSLTGVPRSQKQTTPPLYLEGRAGVVEVLLLLPEHPVGDLPGVWGLT